jgi:high-affinity Fe2+/Pb2+ permease
VSETLTAICLAVIALSTFTMAAIQVGALIYGARLARRLETVIGRVERDIQPIIERLTTVSDEAVRMSQLASSQVERVDQLFSDLARRAEQTMAVVQQAIVTPAREGAALFSALRGTFAAIRGLRSSSSGTSRPAHGVEEDDALFIG